jgi:hypothetical protein
MIRDTVQINLEPLLADLRSAIAARDTAEK